MGKPVVAVEFTEGELRNLNIGMRNPMIRQKIQDALAEIKPLMVEFRREQKAARKGPCPVKCPCICHDTGGADYGMHGGGHCKGVATDLGIEWKVVGDAEA